MLSTSTLRKLAPQKLMWSSARSPSSRTTGRTGGEQLLSTAKRGPLLNKGEFSKYWSIFDLFTSFLPKIRDIFLKLLQKQIFSQEHTTCNICPKSRMLRFLAKTLRVPSLLHSLTHPENGFLARKF